MRSTGMDTLQSGRLRLPLCGTGIGRLLHRRDVPRDQRSRHFVPTRFGDLVTSDHVFMIKKHYTAKVGNTFALTCRDRATRWTMAYPADVIRNRIMSDWDGAKYRGTLDCARKTLKQEGAAGFYRGISYTLVRAIPVGDANKVHTRRRA